MNNAASQLVAEFDRPAVAIIKHANPCGVAQAATPAEAYEKALACDPLSAYGGVIALNRPLDEAVAAAIALGRFGTPDDGAGAVYLLCLPESDFISGQTLICAGGGRL